MSDITKQAVSDATRMNDTSRTGEKVAELMLEDVVAEMQNNGTKPQDIEKNVNKYINAVNSEANKNPGYNLNFEIVDSNNDGKWNSGESVKVHNESRWSWRQPEQFKLDGSPDFKNATDAMLTESAQVKMQAEK